MRFGWDDRDRLTGQSSPDGHSDAYSYTGLGMRLRKSDLTNTLTTSQSMTERLRPPNGAALFVVHITKEHSRAGGVKEANDRRRRFLPRAATLPLHNHKLKR